MSTIPKRLMHTISKRSMHTRFAIVGGGTGGMNVASQLLSSNLAHPGDITVFDPSLIHYYQPGFTMVAGGVLGNNNREIKSKLGGLISKPIEQVFNPNITIEHDSINEYLPNESKLITLKNKSITYDILIVASGIETRYDLIDGLEDALNDPLSPVGSMYNLEYALKINKLRSELEGGRVIGTQAPMPIKCGGAPQKWLYLTEYEFRKQGIREKIKSFKFYTHLNCMFGVEKYDKELRIFMKQKDIEAVYETELIKVDKNKKEAHFKDNKNDGNIIIESYDLLHVTPIQKPNRITALAEFSDNAGFVDVNQHSLQSKKYENVFGLGDCNNCPCPKTAASVFAQTPTIIGNIKRVLNKEKVLNSFDGYASCPIFIGDNKLLLAEFIYGGVPHETFSRFGIDQAKPRRTFYHLKKDFFPLVYWNAAPRGMWYGKDGFLKRELKEL